MRRTSGTGPDAPNARYASRAPSTLTNSVLAAAMGELPDKFMWASFHEWRDEKLEPVFESVAILLDKRFDGERRLAADFSHMAIQASEQPVCMIYRYFV